MTSIDFDAAAMLAEALATESGNPSCFPDESERYDAAAKTITALLAHIAALRNLEQESVITQLTAERDSLKEALHGSLW